MNNKFTEASLNYFFNERNNAKKVYDAKIAELSNNFFVDNNLPFRVGDKVKIPKHANCKIGIIKYVSIANNLNTVLHREPEVIVDIDGYCRFIDRVSISKIKKL